MTAHISITGNIGQEPEARTTKGGDNTLNFSVADSKRRKDDSDRWVDVWTTWYRVTLWQDAADLYADRLHKGDRVIVTGRPRLREYQDRGGNTRQSLEVENAVVAIVPRGERAQRAADPAPAADSSWGPADDTPPF